MSAVETQSTPTPKKSKKTFLVIIILAILFSVDHYKFHYISGSDEVVSADSTKTTTPTVVTTSVTVVDTTKKVVKTDK